MGLTGNVCSFLCRLTVYLLMPACTAVIQADMVCLVTEILKSIVHEYPWHRQRRFQDVLCIARKMSASTRPYVCMGLWGLPEGTLTVWRPAEIFSSLFILPACLNCQVSVENGEFPPFPPVHPVANAGFTDGHPTNHNITQYVMSWRTMNSSYVLIIITSSAELGSGESTSPGCPVKHIMLSFCELLFHISYSKLNSISRRIIKIQFS